MTPGQRIVVLFTVLMAALAGYDAGTRDFRAVVSVAAVWAILFFVAYFTDAQGPSQRRTEAPTPLRPSLRLVVGESHAGVGVYDWQTERTGGSV